MTSNESKKGKGHFKATPLEFELDGNKYTYAGRGRWSVQLATKVVNEGKAPVKSKKDGTWSWRDATADESSSAQTLVNKIASKLKAKADKAAARVAGKATREVEVPVEAEAASVA